MATHAGRCTGNLIDDALIEELLANSDGELSDFDDDDEDIPRLTVVGLPEPNIEYEENIDIDGPSVEEAEPSSKEKAERKMSWKTKRMEQKNLNLKEVLEADYDDEKGIFEALLEYLPLDFWESHAENTCLYSSQTKDNPDYSVKATAEELIHLAGMHLIMGCLCYPQVKMYWQEDFYVPVIANCMPRDRFFELRNYLHFVDNQGTHDESDRLWKVRPILENVRKKCLTLPRNSHLLIDEQMILFSGNCFFRQYVPSKPNPLGLKSFVLAAPDGLVLDFLVYSGKGTVPDEDLRVLGLGGGVVKSLTSTLSF